MTIKTLEFSEVKGLFKNKQEFEEWNDSRNNLSLELKYRELGDYQTPPSLVKRVFDLLEYKGICYTEIIEPTCGKGNFIIDALKRHPDSLRNIIGIERQHEYIDMLREQIISDELYKYANVQLYEENFFDFNLSDSVADNSLIIGNPPWITNSELSSLKSDNLPEKSNFKKNKGFDALTGKANFDIAEFILISLIDNLNAKGGGTIAFLVKNIVIRNILKYSKEVGWNITTFEVYNFDAKKEFGVSADASLLLLRFGESDKEKAEQATVYSLYDYRNPISKFGWVDNEFVSDVEKYLLGNLIEKGKQDNKQFVWRSGIKHDSSKVMELSLNSNNDIVAKDGTVFSSNQEYIFPLYKSSDIRKINGSTVPKRYVIVTQRNIGEDTDIINEKDSKTWEYLLKHKPALDGRKSSIYNGKPQFSIFGVGDYSFSEYKIAISGMYKVSKFSLIEPYNGKPAMVDDTVYFLSSNNKKEALILFGLLNSKIVQSFLKSIAFVDNKRPYTKDILMRISVSKTVEHVSLDEINKILSENQYPPVLQTEYQNFIDGLR